MPLSLTYSFLIAAVAAEVIATLSLARSESFSRLYPSLVTIIGYGIAFYLLSYPLRVMPAGVVYAIWSGLGIVLIALISWLWFGEKLDLPAIAGLSLILAGVLVVNLFSKVVH
ncbi:DMT family transporter [Sneathiella limimaris]|uniref:DMT family transporter n=1 Tax=Sneathiella limimaris TaxID=1964213 RepID=UPI00146E7511|nr:SMR family transporter [Sneathiella limimaris]